MDKYEEALERAKELHEAGNALTKSQMEIVFPELKESEDERIRKEIIDWMKGGNTYDWQENKEKWIAYLEKQKEYIEDIRQYAYNKGLVDAKQQPRWKPSEEQMDALEKAWLECDSKETSVILSSLLSDLQKLL